MSKTGSRKVMEDVLSLYTGLLIPFMKIRRDIPFPTEPQREETDAEHVFSLSIIAIYLNEELGLGLNSELVIKYALAHDLVEAYAGDVSIRAQHTKEIELKKKREHQAYSQIKKRFQTTAPWLVELINNYETRQDDEAKFIYALDKCMGALVRMAGDGTKWKEAYPKPDGSDYHRVVKLLRSKASAYPPILEFFDTVHNELDGRRIGYMKRDD